MPVENSIHLSYDRDHYPDLFIPRGRTSEGGPCSATQAAARRLCRFSTHMKTIVYVDGLNLYYGSLRGTAFKWLDLYALFRDCMLEVDAELERVRYYTAPAKASSSDDPASPARQQRYLHALTAHRGERIQITQGFISRTTPILRLARSRQPQAREYHQTVTITRRSCGIFRCSHRYTACQVPRPNSPATMGIVSEFCVRTVRM